jgi:hypothetical protein
MKATSNAQDRVGHPTGPADPSTQTSGREGNWYEIRIRGQLGSDWSDWFEGLELQPLENGEMVLSGPIVDQAALIGILTRLNRLNLALISVQSSRP